MADLVVIVPSRGRPEAAREVAEAFRETCTADTFLLFAVNDDDPTLDDNMTVADLSGYPTIGGRNCAVTFVRAETMVEALNAAAVMDGCQQAFAIGFMGDDHRPRTVGWDAAYLDALHEFGTGIVYGNDLLQGERIPTQVALTADIVRAVGYMAPPQLTHLFVDDCWKRWGEAVGRIRYLPDVIVEHLHPVAGKAEWDAGHMRVNAPVMYRKDATAFAAYVADGFDADVSRIRALLS